MDAGKEISKKLIDWGPGCSIKYSFITPIFVAKNGKEQRCALRQEPLRAFSFIFFEQTLEATKLLNRLISLLDSEVLVPIYPEQFEVTNTGSLLGVTSLVSNDIEYCYNLQKIACGLYVYDRTGTFEPTVHTIDAVTTTTVSLTTEPITDALAAEDALFFPAVPCVLSDLKTRAITDDIFEIELTFTEKETWQIHS